MSYLRIKDIIYLFGHVYKWLVHLLFLRALQVIEIVIVLMHCLHSSTVLGMYQMHGYYPWRPLYSYKYCMYGAVLRQHMYNTDNERVAMPDLQLVHGCWGSLAHHTVWRARLGTGANYKVLWLVISDCSKL